MSTDVPLFTPKSGLEVASMPIPPWRIKGVLPVQGLAAIYGPPTSGKSFLALDIAASIALGNDWFGHRVRKAPVVYVALEGEGGFPKRLRAWEQYNCHPIPPDLRFIIGQTFELTDPAHVRQLATVIKRGSVVIIDTLNQASPGSDENASDGMGLMLSGCKLLQSLIEGLVIIIHHTGKDESRGLRGHSSLLAAIDASIEVHRQDDSRSWQVAKSKDDTDGAEFCFKLVVEQLGFDDDGDPITSCAIEPTTEAAAPRPARSALRPNQKAVLAAIEPLLVDGPIPWELALTTAIAALEGIGVDSRHRASRARDSLESLIKIKRLSFDAETNEVGRP